MTTLERARQRLALEREKAAQGKKNDTKAWEHIVRELERGEG